MAAVAGERPLVGGGLVAVEVNVVPGFVPAQALFWQPAVDVEGDGLGVGQLVVFEVGDVAETAVPFSHL